MNSKLMAKMKVLQDLMEEMDSEMLKPGRGKADVQVVKIEAKPKEELDDIFGMGEEEEPAEDDYSELADIKKRYSGEEMPAEEEEDSDEYSDLADIRKRYRGK